LGSVTVSTPSLQAALVRSASIGNETPT
jgi:hypothetical protein